MSVGRKFIVWTVSLIFVLGLFTAYFYYRLQMREERKRIESFAGNIAPLIEESLGNYMISEDVSVLEKTMHTLKKIKPVGTLWIINREGIVKVSTDGSRIGTRLSAGGEACRNCHQNKGQKGLLLEGQGIFRWAQPVSNMPQCHKCHDPQIKYNGMIITDFSLEESEKHLRNDVMRGLFVFIPSLLAVGFALFFLSKKVVIERLDRAADAMKRFREGDYNARIPVEGRDEITELGNCFNEMAVAINNKEQELKKSEAEREKNILELQDLLFKVSRSQKKWQETFDAITDLIVILDRDYRIVRANRAVTEYFGLQMKDVINKSCHEIFHALHAPIKGCPFKPAFENRKSLSCDVIDDKNRKTFQVSVFPYFSTGGEVEGMVHIARDVTAERENEMRLIMSERLASLGQMAAGIAHEINNPLSAIVGCAEGLLNRVQKEKYDPELFGNYLKIIEEEVMRCKSITTGMLSFVRKPTYDIKDVDVHELIEKTVEIIGFQGRLREVEVIKSYKEGMPLIKGSEGELRQVFLAIITNALDVMEDRGKLTLETGIEGEGIFVAITDTGPGISPEHITRVLEPFFTTKGEKGGTGLGLSIANRIISNHGGTINVFSETGQGTTFRIILPA